VTIRTSEYERFDTRKMAVGCLHILLSRAHADFPGTTRAAPARWVVVQLAPGGPLAPAYKGYFPYKVIWYVWQNVVVPVLEDPTYQIVTEDTTSLRVSLNQALIEEGDYKGVTDKIEAALIVRLKEQGMVQPDAEPESSSTLVDPVAPGEPIVLPDTDPMDTGDSLVWPEGHPKLTYPEVDGGPNG